MTVCWHFQGSFTVRLLAQMLISALHVLRRFLCTASQGVETGHRRLYLYSKEGCHLCDGLKVALQNQSSRALSASLYTCTMRWV